MLESGAEINPFNGPITADQAATSIEGVVECGTGDQACRGPDSESRVDTPVWGAGQTTTLTSEGVERANRSLFGFWQLLADVGYDAW